MSSTSISLSWKEPVQDQQNGIIIGYIIKFQALDDFSTFNRTSTSTSLTVNMLKPYRSYVCTIAAQTVAGTGPFGNLLMFMTPEAGKITCVLKTNYA